MKKVFVGLMALVALALVLTGCGKAKDAEHAWAEVCTESGKCYVAYSYNGVGTSYSAQESALKWPIKIPASNEEAITIHFVCLQCNTDEVITEKAPFAKVINCNCGVAQKEQDEQKKDKDDATPLREYLVVIAGENIEAENSSQ